jgi:hypothetical protein
VKSNVGSARGNTAISTDAFTAGRSVIDTSRNGSGVQAVGAAKRRIKLVRSNRAAGTGGKFFTVATTCADRGLN